MINLHVPSKSESLRPTITVIGVGGAGGNAVNNMIASGLEGVNFVVANTDAQALDNALTDRTIQLGPNITKGLGAGANPDIGRAAAEEAHDAIAEYIEGSNMVFITAGMGGGTGTGAAAVVARVAKEMGVLTVAVVTKPFQFEGAHRMRLAEAGLKELQECVDTLIIIPNQNLFRIANERTTFADAFKMADDVLHSGVRGVTDLMVKPGLINLDFADIRTVMREMGKAMMGTGEASGERRAIEAAEAAISNPLLDDVSLRGARALLISITGGTDMTLFEVDEAANRIREEVDPEANIIFGSTLGDAMDGKIRVSVVATGIDAHQQLASQKTSAAMGGADRRPFSFAPATKAEAPKPVVRPASFDAPRFQPAQQENPFSANAARYVATERAHTPVRERIEAVEEEAEERARYDAEEQAELRMREPASAANPQEVFADIVASTPPAPRRDQQTVAAQARAAAAAAEPAPAKAGFFQRMAADVGRVFSASPRHDEQDEPQERVQVTHKNTQLTAVEPSDKAKQLAGDDQYLDIPAFLRRQAN